MIKSSIANVNLTWEKLHPEKDAAHDAGKPCARSSHGVSWLPNSSTVIVYGGEAIARTPIEPEQATWAYDSKANAWRAIKSTPPPLRVAHSQALHEPTSTIYIFGGRAGITMEEKAMNDLWKLDCSGPPGTEVWTEVVVNTDAGDAPPEARSFHKMLCIGDSLYVFGGCGANGRMADMHRFDLVKKTWHSLGTSHHLKGRGGTTMLKLNGGQEIGIIAGFDGDEANDGHKFDVGTGKWCDGALTESLKGLRPRSVCIGGSLSSAGVSVIFGGEVDPSDKGHEGAGGFENDIVILEEATGKYLETIAAAGTGDVPETRGWSDGAIGDGKLFVYGGLSGNDESPRRLDDLWVLNVD